MRNEQERLEFCATIMSAARRLGIAIRKDNNGFSWFDGLTHTIIPCPTGTDADGLEATCAKLVNHLSINRDART